MTYILLRWARSTVLILQHIASVCFQVLVKTKRAKSNMYPDICSVTLSECSGFPFSVQTRGNLYSMHLSNPIRPNLFHSSPYVGIKTEILGFPCIMVACNFKAMAKDLIGYLSQFCLIFIRQKMTLESLCKMTM